MRRPQVLSGHSGPVTCGAFTPDGKFIVTGGGDGDASLRAWNPRTGEGTCTIQGHPFHTKGAAGSAWRTACSRRKEERNSVQDNI